jgi:hypothetical protein
MNEHYCRRWISVKTIEKAIAQNNSHYFDAQISRYENSGNSSFHLPRKILSKGLFEKYICLNFDYGKHEEENQVHG